MAELQKAGLDRKEAHTIRERLKGRSLEDISNDRVALVGKKTRERVRQYEAAAAKKLGIEGSIERTVNAPQRAERAADMRAAAKAVEPGERAAPPRPARKTALEVQADRLDKLTDQMLKESEAGALSAERKQFYADQAAKVRGAAAPKPAAPAEPDRRPLPQPGLFKPAAGAGGLTAEQLAAADARARELAAANARPKLPPIPRAKGQPPLRPAQQRYVRFAMDQDVPVDALHGQAAEIKKLDAEDVDSHNEMLRDAWKALREHGVTPQTVRALHEQDATKVKGIDEVAEHLADRWPSKFSPLSEHPSDTLFSMLKEGMKSPITEEAAYERALQVLIDNEVTNARLKAAGDGAKTRELEEALRSGEEAGQAEGDAGDEGHGGDDFAGADVGDFNPAEFGMGAAAAGTAGPGVSPGAPGAAAPVVPERVKPGTVASGWFQRTIDGLKGFAQQQFPSLTRLSNPAGEKLAEVANAPAAAKSSWDYFSRVLKVGDKTLADLPAEDRRAVGAVWLERRMREYRDKLRRRGLDSSKVGTLVGQEGSPLQTEADYQAGRDAMWGFWEAVKQEWTPEVERNFRGIKGLDPGEAIDSLSQIPGLPLNAIAVDPENPVPGAVGTGKRQGMENLRLNKPGFTKTAELSGAAYDVDIAHMMQRTLDRGIPAARRAEFARTAVGERVMVAAKGGVKAPEGWKYLGLDPAGGLGLDPNAKYYVHPDAYRDVVQGLGIGDRPGQVLSDAIKPFTNLLNKTALLSPVELATHTANHVTALFRPGMGVPIANLKDTFTNAGRLLRGDPEINRRVMELAKIGASFGHEPHAGILGERLQGIDPTAKVNRFTSKFIDVMQKSVRVQLDDAYSKLVRKGLVPDTQTGRRDFINQSLGTYNAQAGSRLGQFLKDAGIQPFATAAHTFTTQGVKVATGGAVNAEATSTAAAVRLRAVAVAKLLPFLAIGPTINAARWGQAFPQNVPSFAIKTRDDEDGKTHYFDPLAFTGLRRGWRATGQNAVIEKLAHGGDKNLLDGMLNDAWHTIEHLFAGPSAQFLHTALTGENAMGRQVAAKVSTAKTPAGIAAAEKKGMPSPGSSQWWENVKAAAKGANPVVGSLTDADRPKSPRTWLENLMQSAGPFGEKTREAPGQKKRK
jgi:hypothetical protein